MEYNKLVSEFRDLMTKYDALLPEAEDYKYTPRLNELCNEAIEIYKKMNKHDGELIDIASHFECEDWFRENICVCGKDLGKCNICRRC